MQTITFTNREFMLRIIVSVFCGAAIGFERSRRQKEAGIRTHTIVALGSALMMIVSKYGFFDVLSIEGVGVDASRVAANIITGISFVGAGMIFLKGYSITGLTTASGIWTTAGVGMALGAGMFEMGLFATALIVIIQMIMHGTLGKIDASNQRELTIVMNASPGALNRIQQQFDQEGIVFNSGKIERGNDQTITISLLLQNIKSDALEHIIAALSDNTDIKSITQ